MDQKNAYILIVEDEEDISQLLAYHFKKEKFLVKEVKTAEQALSLVREASPRLIILDLMLPHMSGLEMCKTLKENTETKGIPILMLTAKSGKEDIIKGLECGADDYVTKPFDVREVAARVKAILRRNSSRDAIDIFSYKALKVDWERHKVYVHQKEISLTLTEFKILKSLVHNQGRVLTRERLIDMAIGLETEVIDRTIDVHIQALRKKLGFQYIETIRGIGYRFRDE